MLQQPDFQSVSDRLPPQNIDAEEAILGGILLDPEALSRVMDFLRPEVFYISAHQDIYRGALALHSQGRPTDLMSMASWLYDQSLLEKIGGQSRLTQLIDRTISSVNVDQYANLVMEKYLRRQLIQSGNQIIQFGYDSALPLEVVLDQSEQTVFAITQDRPQTGLTATSEILIDTFSEIESRSMGTSLSGLSCGFYDLDAMTQGFQRSDLIIAAGRPSMGKTSFCLGIARNIAAQYQLPIAIFSLEMSKEQLVYRLLSSEIALSNKAGDGIESSRLRSGRINQHEWERLGFAINTLSQLRLYIDDTANISVSEIRSRCRRLTADSGKPLGLILLDYLQLMEGGSDNRVQELSKVTRSLKGLARELNVPIIALSQLSRGVESRTNKRPMMSDLRESGCLAGETLIPLAGQGQAVPIRELVHNPGVTVWSLNEVHSILEPTRVSRAFCTGRKPVWRLMGNEGHSIRATGNHPFLTPQGWRRLDQIQLGETIATPSHTRLGKEEGETFSGQGTYSMGTSLEWERVIRLEADGESDVYDLTVPEFHNFVANDWVVHNSIEQDADLIIMLYRDEYYNPDTPDRGITEVILTKHRNGPIGTVKLLFKPEFTCFYNMASPNR